MGLSGPKTSGRLGLPQATLPESPCNPHRFLASLLILPLLASLVFPPHTQRCSPIDAPCSTEWSSRIAAPCGQDQACLHFFHSALLLEILCPQLSEGTWPLPLPLMAYTKNLVWRDRCSCRCSPKP